MHGALLMNLAVFLWGFTGVLGRAIRLNEMSLVFWRLTITVASIAVGTLAFQSTLRARFPRAFVSPRPRPTTPVATLDLMIPGMILGIHWICFYGAIKYANVSVALTCLGTAPLIAAILEPLFFRRGIQASELALGSIVFFGILIIYYSHLHFSIGVAYGILASLLTVVVSVLNKRLVSRHSPARMLAHQMAGAWISVVAVFPFYASAFDRGFEWPGLADFAYLLILSWGCTILTFFLWMLALVDVSAFTANVILSLEPVYGIALAFLLYQEYRDISRYFYLGFAIVMGAVMLNVWRTNAKRPHPAKG